MIDTGRSGTLILGLTGNIASGKSTVAKELKNRGAQLVDADLLAREVVQPGSPTLAAIAAEFGQEMLTGEGELNREQLGALIFADEGARLKLNALIHPAIAALARERLQAACCSAAPLLVYEAPLLYEVGAESHVDKVLFVRIEPQVQLKRLMARNGLTELEARQRMEAQMGQQEKAARADYVIDNSGSLEQTLAQLDQLWRELVA
jgi:dephospho-CoA kinase